MSSDVQYADPANYVGSTPTSPSVVWQGIPGLKGGDQSLTTNPPCYPCVTTVLATTSPAWGSQSPLTPADTRWGWVPAAAVALGALLMFGGARRRNPYYRRNIDAFTDARGIIHPIRESSGYDEDVEKIDAEERERQEQAERYRGIEAESERSARGDIERPPWAAGISNAQLIRIARDHGVNAGRPLWWESAGLYSGMGELREELREGGHRGQKSHKGEAAREAAREVRQRASHAHTREERLAERAEARRRSKLAAEDLPF